MNTYTPTLINTVVLIIYMILGPWLEQNQCFLLGALMALIQFYVIYSLSSESKHEKRMNQLTKLEGTTNELLDYKQRVQALDALDEAYTTQDKDAQAATIISSVSMLIRQQNEATERKIKENKQDETDAEA